MDEERTEINPLQAPEEEKVEFTLRPKNLDEFIGQENLRRISRDKLPNRRYPTFQITSLR